MRNQPQPLAVSGGANVQSAHEKTKQGLCSDAFLSFCKIYQIVNKADTRADGLRSVPTMIDCDGQSITESIMNLIPRSFGP
jgi:hypothetical protein